MIDYLRGRIAHREPEFIVLDVNGVGYRMYCADPQAIGGLDGREITVYAHHHVREDAMLLFGFATRGEQSLFRKLIEVSGVGPKVALGAMSGSRPEALASAIWREDVAYLTRLPGIGKKTAQRIILDLKDKLGAPSGIADAGIESDAAEIEEGAAGMSSAAREAREGLRALGFSDAEIDRVWPQTSAAASGAETGETADALIKAALRQLYKG